MKRTGFLTPAPKRPKLMTKIQTCPDALPKNSVSVFCRIKPLENTSDNDMFALPVNNRTVKLIPPPDSFAFRNGSAKEQHFRFQWVFSKESSQADVFEMTAKPLIIDLLNGQNALLFVYGITGSGKTYTMEGTRRDGGIVRRTIHTIFNSISEYQTMKYTFKPDKMNGFDVQSEADAMLERQKFERSLGIGRRLRRPALREVNNTQISGSSSADSSRITAFDEDNGFAVFVNYIEIYNNYVYDLLEEFSGNNMTKDLQTKILREDAKHNMYVHGCTEVEVKSPEEAFEVLLKGQKRRKVAHTKLNFESSRSHSVFTVRVVQAPHDEKGEHLVTDKSSTIVSQFSMVDLAGSERNNRTNATGDRIKEAGNINNSLMALRQCIETLRENQINRTSKKVPYRDSRLTHYFKNYFEGEGKVRMIVCVNPNPQDYDETLPVMKFAELASEVEVHHPTLVTNTNFGFTPGRRRANQVFKEVRMKIEEQMNDQQSHIVDTLTPMYSLGPNWIAPACNSVKEVGDAFGSFIEFNRKRKVLKTNLYESIREQALVVRNRISEMETENVHLRQQSSSYASLYEDAMKKIKFYEAKLFAAELHIDTLGKQFSDYNVLLDEYKQVCEERDFAKSQSQMDKQKIKTRLKMKLEAEKERMMNDFHSKLLEHKQQLKVEMFETQMMALQQRYLQSDLDVLPSNSKE